MIGTSGAQMLRRTARSADLWNVFIGEQGTGNRVERIPALREAVYAASVVVGRDPATLARSAAVKIYTIPEVPLTTTAYTPLVGSPEEPTTALRACADEGISHVQLWIEPNTPAGIAAFVPVLEVLARQ